MSTSDRTRLTVDLDCDQKTALKNLIPWGMQRAIISNIISLTITFIETNGLGKVIDALADSKVKIVIVET